jgi:phage terminase large subunit
MNQERLHCQETDPDNYDNIWEGKCRPAVEGAIYFKQIQQLEEEGRITQVPHDVLLKTHVVFDLGWEDSVAIGMIQRNASSVRIIDYIEDSHKTLAEYSAMLKARPYNYGQVFLPHDGFSKDVATGKSSEDVMRALGWDVVDKKSIGKLSVEEGIKATRIIFPRLFIDKVKCELLIERLKRYRRQINRQTETPGNPLHDLNSHGADMLRYTAVNVDLMQNHRDSFQYADLMPEQEEVY